MRELNTVEVQIVTGGTIVVPIIGGGKREPRRYDPRIPITLLDFIFNGYNRSPGS